jgi:adenylate kinase
VIKNTNKKSIGFIFGPNGVGKGTLADNICDEFNYYHFSMGVVIGKWANERGHKKIREQIDEGEFVDDEHIREALLEKVESLRHRNIIFDGVPRKITQVKLIKEVCEKFGYDVDWAIVLDASMDVIVERLTERVVAPDGKIYHLKYNPPPKKYSPDELVTRPDDRPEIVKKRYKYYVEHTLESLNNDYFEEVPTLKIDATKTIAQVTAEAEKFVKKICESKED